MASSAQTQPVLRKVDISANPTVLTVATTLRRLWLVDPASPVLAEQLAKLQEEGGQEHEHDHDHSNRDGHDHDHEHNHAHAHEADLDDKDEHDHANCEGHDHDHDHNHDHAEEDDDESSCGCGHDHDEEDSELHQIFPIALQSIANQIGEAANPNDDAYDDEKWKASTDLVLIEPPAGLASPFSETPEDDDKKEGEDEENEDEDETISSPLFTPFRQQVYGIYNHVFYDAYSSLKAELGGDAAASEIGEFEPPATTVMVLEAPAPDDPEKGIPHEFETDTFVYPVWIAKATRLVVKEEGKEEEMVRFGDDGKRWTEVVWFRRGSQVVVYPESEGEAANFKGVVALLALGVCEPVGGAGEGADADVE